MPRRSRAASPNPRVRIRMYRVGVGDCFLLTFPRDDGSNFRMLIDCGIHQSTSGGSNRIRKVVDDLVTETENKLDLLVITHEHADHISGFRLAKPKFEDLEVENVWFAWTENDTDPFAQDLVKKRQRAVRALTHAHARMRLMGLEGAENPLEGLLGFYGGGAGAHSKEALEVIRSISKKTHFREPGEPPFEIPGVDARIFVLGPPRSKELIKKDAPSRSNSEVYHFGAFGDALAAIEPALGTGSQTPFDDSLTVPLEGSKAIRFYQDHYWSARVAPPSPKGEEATTQDWRRIDQDWLDAATSLALKLDQDTNNTSLVLAIELGKPDEDGQVLLFAADAQVGNWLSWQDVASEDDNGRRVTGPDLLRRTVIYKVGHHASHNATLRELGLEMMDSLELALVPTDKKMAEKVHWGDFPFPALLDRLGEKTGNKVVRTDRELPAQLGSFSVTDNDLFYEVAF